MYWQYLAVEGLSSRWKRDLVFFFLAWSLTVMIIFYRLSRPYSLEGSNWILCHSIYSSPNFISFLLKQLNPISFYLFILDFISSLLNQYLATLGLIPWSLAVLVQPLYQIVMNWLDLVAEGLNPQCLLLPWLIQVMTILYRLGWHYSLEGSNWIIFHFLPIKPILSHFRANSLISCSASTAALQVPTSYP
jgi:hypothetical protein